MIIRDAKLDRVCGQGSVLPSNSLPEIAFAGRSNAGKSSLINLIMNRKSLARTSAQPGKTRTVNYYRVDAFEKEGEGKREMPFFLVDLPGYGYAKTSRDEAHKWGVFIEDYLHTSEQLRCVFLLLDIRRDPDDNDRMMMDWIRNSSLPAVVAATKSDRIKRSQVKARLAAIKKSFGHEDLQLFAVSTQTRAGLEEIYRIIAREAYGCDR